MADGVELQFFAWTRSGIGALLAGTAKAAVVDLGAAGQPSATLTAYGATDVTGFDPRAVLRTVPSNGVRDFEPNLFACVELAHPGLPWMVSGPVDAAGRTMPWITLVVVADGPGVTLSGQQLAIAPPARPVIELPDLAQAWAWAHAQVASVEGSAFDTAPLGRSAGAARSRLVCPRKLAPNTAYIACVVPTAPGWTGTETSIVVPVLYAWRFSTAADGDFASLVRRLGPFAFDASVGHRAIDISSPGWGMPTASGATLDASCALRSPAWSPPAPGASAVAIGDAIASQLDASIEPPSGRPPVFAPPFYGAAATRADAVATAPVWQSALNKDVGQRIAAGLGADVIRADVDTFVDAAWQAVGDTEAINAAIRHAELAAEITQRLADKHLAGLGSAAEVLAIARPMLARIKLTGNGGTLAATIATSAMPSTALSASLRRLGRSDGTIGRRVTTATGDLLAGLDSSRITAVPVKTLASGAAGFDRISVATRSPTRLVSLSASAVTASATHWKTRPPVATRVALAVVPVPIPAGERNTVPPLTSQGGASATQIDDFAAAARLHQAYIVGHLDKIPDGPKPLGDLTPIRAAILDQLTPARGVLPLLASRIDGLAITKLEPVRATPVLGQPLIRTLAARSPELVMPGFGTLPANRAALAVADAGFVRAFLVGANEQLGRELLWRRFPAALGHTWLQTFWGRVAPRSDGSPQPVPDIPPIESWPAAGPSPAPATLVLVVRGDVLQRYPNAVVYALAARWQGTQRVLGDGAPVAPVIATTLASDVALFGFELTVADAVGGAPPAGSPGWYFVIAEHPHEPRFGLAAAPIANATRWRDVAWSDVVAADLRGDHLRVDGPLAQRHMSADPGLTWGSDAAQLAAITLRRATRVALHASTLVSP